MAGKTGAGLYVHWVDASGTVILASGTSEHFRTFNPNIEKEMAEVTAGAASIRNYKATLATAEPEMTIIMRDEGTAITDRLKLGVQGSLVWGIEGTAAGRPKAGITAEITVSNSEATYDAELEITIQWMPITGAWLFNPATAVWP